jgi:hypothetical protein
LGGGLLVLGLAAVGAGASVEGGPFALAGLLATIYGIHRFGRLGPEEVHDGRAAPDRVAAIDALWLGALAIVAGLSFVIGGGGGGTGAYAVLLGGAIALAWGSRANRGAPARGAPAPKRAEDERATDEEQERPQPRRKRARRKAAGA